MQDEWQWSFKLHVTFKSYAQSVVATAAYKGLKLTMEIREMFFEFETKFVMGLRKNGREIAFESELPHQTVHWTMRSGYLVDCAGYMSVSSVTLSPDIYPQN